jgi:AmmeMemoRadiSam system protein A
VPLYFISHYLTTPYKLVRVSISLLDELVHYRLGECVSRVADKLGRKTVFIASGDLSHRLKSDGPYGFNSAGPQFDEEITTALANGDFARLLEFDEVLREDAGECGLSSCIIMAGALDGLTVEARLLSYEGPWGVGYGLAAFRPQGEDESRHFGRLHQERLEGSRGTSGTNGMPTERCHGHSLSARQSHGHGLLAEQDSEYGLSAERGPEHSLPVRLAFAALRDYLDQSCIPTQQTPAVAKLLDTIRHEGPSQAEDELRMLSERRAGVFVSFKENGELRGCIGTIGPAEPSILDEILQNTLSAAANDPRFSPIHPDELPILDCTVDILGDPEPIDNASQLDPRRYGVIVQHGLRRGLLLPDLEGVDTAEEQIAIALRKAGIRPDKPYWLERFEVVRYK